jgi:hypothetical protein
MSIDEYRQSAEEYRRRATDLFQLAEATTDIGQKAWLLELAQAWLSLADQAEKNSAADLWYETPPHGDEVRPSQQQQQPQPKKEGE